SDINNSDGGVFQILRNMQHSYTIIPEVVQGWRWGTSITTLLIPQRGFLLGIPLAVMVITLWWDAMQERKSVPPASAGGSKKRLNPPTDAGGTDPSLPTR